MINFERIKSIVLTFLVLASFVLTWNLWTYQSNYETMEKINFIKEVSISKKQEIIDILKPDRVLYHHDKNHYGTEDKEEIDSLIGHLLTWDFYNVQDISQTIADDEFVSFVHGSGTIEIVFPNPIPIEQYNNVLHFEEKKLPSFEFDRIVIDVKHSQDEDGKVYFVFQQKKQVYASDVSTKVIRELEQNFYRFANKHPSYFAYDTGNKRLFILNNEPTFARNKYFMSLLNVDLFKNALFSNPSVVQKTFLSTEDEYTDSSSIMTACYNYRVLSYVNPVEESNHSMPLSTILQQSIDFMNEHSGWTDEYHFAESGDQTITFRLYVDGKPVFNQNGMSEIVQVWGENKIYKYIRPYFTLDIHLVPETAEITLPSGKDVVEYLEAKEGYDPKLLEEVIPAYKMIKDQHESRVIILEPSWYYRYNHVWEQIKMDDLGGFIDGLE